MPTAGQNGSSDQALYRVGIVLNPAVGALLMSLSTVIVAINAKFLKIS